MEKIYDLLFEMKQELGVSAKVEMQLEKDDSLRIRVGWITPDLGTSKSAQLVVTRAAVENDCLENEFEALAAQISAGAQREGNRRMTAALSPAGVRLTARLCVAALYVQPDGCYAGLPDVDAWPAHRDARRYAGPLPVVAHPPCQLWGAMANVNYARWGGEHNRPGNDGGCFASALESVRRFGGVLEHPAKTKAWAAHGLAKPTGIGWQRTIDGGWVCEVWQSAYGHRANKATWLYYYGTTPPFELRWDRPKGTHQSGFHDQRGKAANKPTLGKREANATPIAFRDDLLRLALNSDAYERRRFNISGQIDDGQKLAW